MIDGNLGVAIAALAAFFGAMSGVATIAWWLAAKFGDVYNQLAVHETKDVERFTALRGDIADIRMQAQIAAALLGKKE